MNRRRWLHGRWLHGCLAVLLLVLLTTSTGRAPGVRADSAPMWPSPVGLAPGYPGTAVRLVSETVEIQVVERNSVAFALVDATFNLLNDGPDATMQVGFPTYATSVLALGPDDAYSPVAFHPDLSSFTARSDDGAYQVSRADVVLGDGSPYGSEWYVWEMAFPSRRPVRLHVAYAQQLSWDWDQRPTFAQVMYVLRTGALWDGPIGEATVTMIAPDGGIFLGGPELLVGAYGMFPAEGDVQGPEQAVEATETRLVWRLHDAEPAHDVGALYVYADAWRTLLAGERAEQTGSTDVEPYLRAGRMALRLTGSDGEPWGPFGAPAAILERGYHHRARAWAQRATIIAPEQAAPWELLGDVELWFARPASKHFDELACWPTAALEAYQRAVERGSPTAAARIERLDESRAHTLEFAERDPAPCP